MDLVNAFRLQAAACARLESALYERLLEVAADDLAAGGATATLLGDYHGDPVMDAVALRVMAGTHHAALSGAAPALAAHYPTAGGQPRFPACATAFLETIASAPGELRDAVRRPPQTNEIGRSVILVGGLLEIGRLTGLPIHLLEIGSSAGLNLQLDRFRYELPDAVFGDVSSTVALRCDWRGSPPMVGDGIRVVERRGCDVHPLRVADPGDAMRLTSFVWADQVERFAQMERAIELARRHPVAIDAEAAETWLPDRLSTAASGVATVVMHSVVMQYLPATSRRHVMRTVRAAGRVATAEAPVAWLRFEPGHKAFELSLSLWPPGLDIVVAHADPHGRWVEWFVGTEPR